MIIKKIYILAIGIWFIFMILAIVNGTLRNYVYGPLIGKELIAHQISTVTAVLLFFIAMYLFFTYTEAEFNNNDLIAIGVLWLGMTILFEFIFGHYVIGHSWSRLLHDYNLLEGRVWIFVLIWTFFGPYVIGKYFLIMPDDHKTVYKNVNKISNHDVQMDFIWR